MANATAPFWRLPDGWHGSDEALRLGLHGRAAFFSYLDYCNSRLNDGVVTVPEMSLIVHLAGVDMDAAETLVSEGVLVLRDGKYHMPGFARRFRTQQDVDEDRAKKVAAGRKGGLTKARNAQARQRRSSKPLAPAKHEASTLLSTVLGAELGDGGPIGIPRPPVHEHRREAAV